MDRRYQRTSADHSARASGNGSIMRLAPVPIRYAGLFPDRLEELARYLAESSLPTHASPQCLSACAYLGLVLCGLIHGIDREEVLAPDWEPLVRLRTIQPLHPEVEEVAAGSFRRREAVLRAVNLGDDADTTGAVCGQLAGACWGETGIPEEWREKLARPAMIEHALGGLL
ncbi:MAG: ADP-ribosylglycohydrolase family protein [Planctomycetia bacterium]|nr:ADP-ribosylglycohydrolase family protein [Planctomycetia bacterium]